MTVDTSLMADSGQGPLTVNQFGESYLFAINRHSFERLSAEVQFSARYAERLSAEDTLHIVIGTDSGLLLRFVEQHCLGKAKGSRYLFIEPETVLQALLQYGLLSDLHERIAAISMTDWVSQTREFKINDYLYINGVRSTNALCAQDDPINEYAELSWHVTELLAQLHWQTNAELGSEAFINRQIENIADNRWPAKWLEKAFTGQTVLLLAGGPSLDQALDWAKQHRQQLVIFAVSRIARQLLAAGIEPDFLFSVDPTELSFDISKEMLLFGPHTTLITSYHVVPSLLSQWTGRVFYLGERLPWKSSLNVANFVSVGPTVTNTALQMASHMGFKRVILAGVDLCFTRQGFTHATGSNEQLAGPRFNLTSLQVETNNGDLAPTSCDFAHAIKALHAQAILLKRANCQVLNCAASAAKVDGIEYLPLDEIELAIDKPDVLTVVSARLQQAPQARDYLHHLDTELQKALFQTRSIKQLASEARKLNDVMYQQVGTLINFKDKQALDKIEKKFRREYRQFSKLIKKIGIRRLILLAKPFNDEEWSIEEVQQLGAAYYDAYLEGAGKLERLLERAQKLLLVRQQEWVEQPDWAVLFEQTLQSRSFGRARLWRQQFAVLDLPDEVRQQFDHFDQQFATVLAEQNTTHFNQAKRHSQLSTVKQRASLLFKHQKAQELQDLLGALDKHDDAEATQPYRLLIEGYLAELNQQAETALASYQQLIDSGELMLEEALQRIAVLAIQAENSGDAELALRCLAQLNPLYLPFYAQILRLCGETVAAIDAYNQYIERFPSDHLVQVKLANLYLECQLYDAAQMMVDYLLVQQPDLSAALSLNRQLQGLKALA